MRDAQALETGRLGGLASARLVIGGDRHDLDALAGDLVEPAVELAEL